MIFGIFLLILGCKKEENQELSETKNFELQIPNWFPNPEFPVDNEFTLERWKLGKKLFFDPSLSLNQTVSCSSCHNPNLAFGDSQPTSIGDLGAIGTSNSPPLFNVAYHPYYTRAGGVPTLEMQVAVPVQEHNEFNQNMVDLVERLAQNPEYQEAAQRTYGRSFDAYTMTRALATFERSLISGHSDFDLYSSLGNTSVLSESEKRGMDLFFSDRTSCASCHSGFNFTSYQFENNGLYEVYADSGRMRLTHLEQDRAKFKIPSLRNIQVSAPYMHDGSIASLTAVVSHYNSGGANHVNKSSLIRPLGLTSQEESDLVAFLFSLTDYSFINNSNFQP